MRWRGRRGSVNVSDRRGSRGVVRGGAGGLGVLAIVLVGWLLGVDLTPLLGEAEVRAPTRPSTAAEEEAGAFVSVVLADTEDVWAAVFRDQVRESYHPPTLVLFSGMTNSGCGQASAATGPFYCPLDGRAYLDTAFFTALERRFGAGGDFAAAYVVAHEVAHHVQREIGILGEAHAIRRQVSESESNAISVRLELQADCLAGLWAHHAQERFAILEEGDVAEAMNAAAQIGDDILQQRTGTVRPETFTHGTGEQRQDWFRTGFETGEIRACDTFEAEPI
ncbi:KPN_02809 family neutral zinc metallopeptidase [Roseitranquillus sediminis]|uniref:KPN_02809 family neutral zinc metallopeptidase n=1 Tax=Roseitranquillus sediminis TaxID=2809051 RepID=UPI001D0C0550|nr:neutral zinc metallopeptidase [Roseitranquillus sediminis]MBM9595617.1 neutral zinc metallopeptidase [Roseitranquillus sediminis]